MKVPDSESGWLLSPDDEGLGLRRYGRKILAVVTMNGKRNGGKKPIIGIAITIMSLLSFS